MSETRAVLRGVRLSVDKGRLVADLIRGKKVDQALADLAFSRKRIAQDVRKVVMIAVANADDLSIAFDGEFYQIIGIGN